VVEISRVGKRCASRVLVFGGRYANPDATRTGTLAACIFHLATPATPATLATPATSFPI
jgi:hypothetical protein